MKTTELFVEQVLIGLLVISIVGLVVYDYANPFVTLDSLGSFELIVTGGLLIGSAYLIGMVYDRLSDTLLQDFESHCRIHFIVSSMKPEDLTELLDTGKDPFEEGKYRIIILSNPQATNHMEYLRSRIRLTRSLTTLLPALMVSSLLVLDHEKANPFRLEFAIAIPIAYFLTLLLKMREKPKGPPKTYQTLALRAYLNDWTLPKCSKQRTRAGLKFSWRDEVWIGMGLLALTSTLQVLANWSYARVSILFAGLLLTIIVGWSWWRISLTFYSFLRDYERFGDCKPVCRAEIEEVGTNLKHNDTSSSTTEV